MSELEVKSGPCTPQNTVVGDYIYRLPEFRDLDVYGVVARIEDGLIQLKGRGLGWWMLERFQHDRPTDTDLDQSADPINPSHYKSHPSGIEAIQITEHMTFNLGNAVKYIWRNGQKGDAAEDIRKAIWYLEREIQRLGGGK